ncbi:hypothetical protein PSE_2674 [Pseudovibrio sp. FO-BEG1]|nr:hypothetical protein PSE_2674 [Pseudovibrio sp. FO-BEG1]
MCLPSQVVPIFFVYEAVVHWISAQTYLSCLAVLR